MAGWLIGVALGLSALFLPATAAAALPAVAVSARPAAAAAALPAAAPAALPAAAAALPAAAPQAPDAILPSVRHFEGPFADPLEPRTSIGLLTTDVLSKQGGERPVPDGGNPSGSAREWQAVATIGATIPILRLLERPEGGVVLSGQAGVFARFRVELPSRDDLGQDWVVAMPIEMAWNDVSGRVRIVHRSAHLGDEFTESTGAERIEFGGEGIDLLIAQRIGEARVYGGGEWTFHSTTDDLTILRQIDRWDRYRLQFGFDGEWGIGSGQRGRLKAGLDCQFAQRTTWRRAMAGAAGVMYDVGTRAAGFVVRFHDGMSPMGQFFLTPETLWSIEFNLTL